ncbi:hypothetical protein B0H10DRAFT_1966097 [Mycena sp. CBHHK59/15]|nr:hypothetical protein B0H10DRAFT_1966097 [Mycena sp. CBHHK59/15]
MVAAESKVDKENRKVEWRWLLAAPVPLADVHAVFEAAGLGFSSTFCLTLLNAIRGAEFFIALQLCSFLLIHLGQGSHNVWDVLICESPVSQGGIAVDIKRCVDTPPVEGGTRTFQVVFTTSTTKSSQRGVSLTLVLTHSPYFGARDLHVLIIYNLRFGIVGSIYLFVFPSDGGFHLSL